MTLIVVPVLRRPHRVTPLLDTITEATPEPHRILFVCSREDAATQQTIAACHAEQLVVPWAHGKGDYSRKINLACSTTDDDTVFLAADDLRFHPGWLKNALHRLTEGVGVVGTNDLCNRRTIQGTHSTHSLVTRDYIARGTVDEPGKVLHEGYWHEFVDDEFVQTAMARGAYAHATDSIVEHLHPMRGKAPMDDLYAMQGVRMREGRKVYEARRHLWTAASSSPPTATPVGSG